MEASYYSAKFPAIVDKLWCQNESMVSSALSVLHADLKARPIGSLIQTMYQTRNAKLDDLFFNDIHVFFCLPTLHLCQWCPPVSIILARSQPLLPP